MDEGRAAGEAGAAGAGARGGPLMVGESERWLSVIGGGMLILSSLRRRDAGAGALFALAGSVLVFRGIVGHEGFFAAVRGVLTGAASGSDEG